jgi:hypothetical protein
MACSGLGLFAVDTSPNYSLCFSARTSPVYGTTLGLGNYLYSDSGCTFAYSTSYLSDGSNIYVTNGSGKITEITACACNFLGTFASASDPNLSCISPLLFDLWGPGLLVGNVVYIDSGCTSPSTNTFYSDGVTIYEVDSSGTILSISTCSCPGIFCVQNDSNYDDTYVYAGMYGSYTYYTGQTNGYSIFYSTGETRWCLAQNLGDPCNQFGPYGSVSTCPDLDDSVVYYGSCITTTTTTNPCVDFNFEAIFDCYIPPTPSFSPTPTHTPTPTPTPTTSNICGGVSMVVTSTGVTPTPTPSYSPTPTPTPQVERPCNFSGEVVFNTFSEIIQCANSKKFRDCFTGIEYFTSDLVLVSGSTSPKENYVYNATINGLNYCVIYDGLFENISGVDNITLTNEVGSVMEGSCLECVPSPKEPVAQCLVIHGECGTTNVSPNVFINGKLSYIWSFSSYPAVYRIYWDNLNVRWVAENYGTNVSGSYLYKDTQLPIGSSMEWVDNPNHGPDETCLTQSVGFYTTVLDVPCPTPSATPTPTPTPSPCVSSQYRITNISPSKITAKYFDCVKGMLSVSISPNSSLILCSTTTPSTANPQNLQITNLGTSC